ncbi:arginine repressor, ArgR [Sulfobacillus acidophilus TPY]|uniref:Arginine repressor n=1 Tax=Sulfobacillus acidophilus (strain ATCC 700253 / DSM 10332 / NAL) TaxID=679936 RepID=G8TS30_SULAD|nr:arginine repressor, ArgR [Sulfobacillus acidophilus TPY]AEW04356.1 transcriptional regulator, ArgR family [Sulfobacillus acidophilus DSM 10332]MCY0864375.1 arginine repressor [Sulfobacillus sp.]
MREKQRRQQFLRELVATRDLETQEALVRELRRAGFHVTQVTVSRDIRDLHLVKTLTPSGRYRYSLPAGSGISAEARLDRMLAESYVSVRRANNLVVLKVLPGNAHAVAAILDQMELPHLLGTVAGDDTLLIICEDDVSARSMETRLRPAQLPPEHHASS